MIYLLITSFLFLCLQRSFGQNECPINYSCNNTITRYDNKVPAYCKSQKGSLIDTDRCCIFNKTIIGLDLRYCEVKHLNISYEKFSGVEILDIRHNDFEKFTHIDLLGLVKLDYLYLSSHFFCPGGKAAWNVTATDKDTTSCLYQRNYCTSLNITCGDENNANCQPKGPGSAKCICNPGYYGYKCLNQGIFPTTVFSTSVVIPMVVLSIVLWFVHGRDPYRRRTYIEE